MPDQPVSNQMPMNRIVVYSFIFLVLAIGAGMVFARFIAMSQSDKVANNSAPQYIPVVIDNGTREITGKILTNFDTNVEATHRLLDKDLNLIAYLIANNDILTVSEGFSVTVVGEVDSMTKDGVEIIRVSKIKLK